MLRLLLMLLGKMIEIPERRQLQSGIRTMCHRIAAYSQPAVDGEGFSLCFDGGGGYTLYVMTDVSNVCYSEKTPHWTTKKNIQYHHDIEILRLGLDRLRQYAPLDALDLELR